MKEKVCIALFLVLLTAGGFSTTPRKAYRIKTIVIDAGHGGHDTGCLGGNSKEKNIALAIALRLGSLIEKNYSDVKVIYTRKTDEFIPLHERANIANKAKADLFICIHLNSGSKAAIGPETYVMGLHKTDDNLNVAKRENAAILLEDDYQKQYDGFDPNSPEANIIFSLYQNQFMHQSLMFASNVQSEFDEFAGRNNRGVKQAGFLVLYKTAMPAVLIECGFLSNDDEERFLLSEKGQNQMANSIYRAFKAYKIDNESGNDEPSVEKNKSNGKQNGNISKDDSTPSQNDSHELTASSDNKTSSPVEQQNESKPKKEEKNAVKESKNEPALYEVIEPDNAVKKNSDVKPENTVKPESAVKAENTIKTETKVKEEKKVSAAVAEPKVFFTIQIGASQNPGKDDASFLKIKGCKSVKGNDGYTRYIVGQYISSQEARSHLSALKSLGFKDAFLAAFNGNEKITVPEAEKHILTK